jgi:DNA modification methylase
MTSAATAANAQPTSPVRRRLGNRLNDLSWKDWLLYQKSFFQVTDDSALFKGIIEFFTKRRTPEGRQGHVLALSFDRELPLIPASGRNVVRGCLPGTQLKSWCREPEEEAPFDLLIVDMRAWQSPPKDDAALLRDELTLFYEKCRRLLRPEAFCVVLGYEDPQGEGSFPLPWVAASAARGSFRLRDEKIGLEDDAGKRILYMNVLQAVAEIGPGTPPANSFSLAVGPEALSQQWVKPRPKPRQKTEILHPAKFPEELVSTFISALSDEGDTVLDPMGGTASSALAALRLGRSPVVIELDAQWAALARTRLEASRGLFERDLQGVVVQGDARDVRKLVPKSLRPVKYTVTSPPYWRMLHNVGMHVPTEGQRARRAKGLKTTYSDSEKDLGNVGEYEQFIEELAVIYERVARVMSPGSVLTCITKNIKYERAVYPIAWDLVFRLCNTRKGKFEYAGTTFWCQDDVGLKPFGMGCDWISNILHHYCIHLRVR